MPGRDVRAGYDSCDGNPASEDADSGVSPIWSPNCWAGVEELIDFVTAPGSA
jgi:hypothetical protein